MKTIYLSIAAALVIGSLNAQTVKQKHAVKMAGKTEAAIASRNNARHTSTGTHVVNATRSITSALSESFEGSMPPIGWTAGSTDGADWYSSSTSTGEETVAAGHTGHFAIFDNYDYTQGDEGYLITPTLLPTAGDNTLSFSVNVYNLSTNSAYMSSGAELYVDISTDGGATWTSGMTNELSGLPNYNTTTNTGWVTRTTSLAAYDGMSIKVRFRAVSDYGWSNLGLDNVSGPAQLTVANDVSVTSSTSVQINGFDYFEVIPNSQLVEADFGVVVANNGSNAQTNVTLNANINGGMYTSSTGLNNPVATMAAGEVDTMWASVMPAETTPTVFVAGLNVTQNETDADPSNNMGDSAYFIGSDNEYFRTLELGAILSSYSFGSSAPAVSGMEYGATYIAPNAGMVDSISTDIYYVSGTGTVVGKLYTIDPSSGAFTNVASTSVYTPAAGYNTAGNLTTLALTTPYSVPAGTLLCATFQLNITPGTDSIFVGSDNAFPGDASVAGAVYLKVGSSFQWSSIVGQVPMVGMMMDATTTGIANKTADNTVNVYPNPSNGVVTINTGAANKSTVEVYNVIGEVVFAQQFNTASNTIDLGAFGTGVYSVKVTTDKNTTVKKVMVTK